MPESPCLRLEKGDLARLIVFGVSFLVMVVGLLGIGSMPAGSAIPLPLGIITLMGFAGVLVDSVVYFLAMRHRYNQEAI